MAGTCEVEATLVPLIGSWNYAW